MHILISYKDNPSFSLYHTSLGRNCKALERKNWRGFNHEGMEQYYTNSPGVSHILIENCSLEEFSKAVSYEPIHFRLVEVGKLEKFKQMFGNSTLKLDIKSVLLKDLIDLSVSEKPTVTPSI